MTKYILKLCLASKKSPPVTNFGHKVTKKYHNTRLVIKGDKLQSFKSKDVILPSKPHNSSSRLILEHGQVNIPSTLRCYGCLIPDQYCTVPCGFPQKCFLRAPTPYSSSKRKKNLNE